MITHHGLIVSEWVEKMEGDKRSRWVLIKKNANIKSRWSNIKRVKAKLQWTQEPQKQITYEDPSPMSQRHMICKERWHIDHIKKKMRAAREFTIHHL